MTSTYLVCVCSSSDLFNYGCRCDTSNIFNVWHNGVDWVCARNIEEAREIVKKWGGYKEGDEEIDGDEGWSVVPADKELTFHDGPDDDSITTLTAKEWADEIGQPEYIGSREF